MQRLSRIAEGDPESTRYGLDLAHSEEERAERLPRWPAERGRGRYGTRAAEASRPGDVKERDMKDRTDTDAEIAADWESVSAEYRDRWRDRGDRSWDDVEPAYRVGWEIRQRGGRERGWPEVEPEFRRTWSERYPDKPWDRFLDAAQDVWDDLTGEPGPSPHAGEAGTQDESSRR
jgi:hypothetical protein